MTIRFPKMAWDYLRRWYPRLTEPFDFTVKRWGRGYTVEVTGTKDDFDGPARSLLNALYLEYRECRNSKLKAALKKSHDRIIEAFHPENAEWLKIRGRKRASRVPLPKDSCLTREEIREVIDRTADYHGITADLDYEVKDSRASRARYRTNTITLSTYIFRRKRDYAIAIIVHEVTHFAAIGHGHGPKFRKLEVNALRDLYGYTVGDYKKAYWRELNGRRVYE